MANNLSKFAEEVDESVPKDAKRIYGIMEITIWRLEDLYGPRFRPFTVEHPFNFYDDGSKTATELKGGFVLLAERKVYELVEEEEQGFEGFGAYVVITYGDDEEVQFAISHKIPLECSVRQSMAIDHLRGCYSEVDEKRNISKITRRLSRKNKSNKVVWC